MAKIFDLFEGDTWINSSGKSITVEKVLTDGHVMVSSPTYSKLYRLETRAAIYNINNGTYKDFMSKIPDVFIVHANQKQQQGKTKYTLCRSLLHKFYSKGLLSKVPNIIYGDYLLCKGKTLQVLDYTMAVSIARQEKISIVEYSRFVSIYNSISFKLKRLPDVNKNQENREQRREETINPCQEISLDKKRIDSSESDGQDERQVRLSSKIGKIRIEKSETGGEIRFKRSESRFKIPTIQWRVQHREICRA